MPKETYIVIKPTPEEALAEPINKKHPVGSIVQLQEQADEMFVCVTHGLPCFWFKREVKRCLKKLT